MTYGVQLLKCWHNLENVRERRWMFIAFFFLQKNIVNSEPLDGLCTGVSYEGNTKLVCTAGNDWLMSQPLDLAKFPQDKFPSE